MKGHGIAEQVRVGSLPREANGGEIGTCIFSAEAGVKENTERSYSTVTLFARLQGWLAASVLAPKFAGSNFSQSRREPGPTQPWIPAFAGNAGEEECASDRMNF